MGRFGWCRFNTAARDRVGEKAIQRIGLSAPSNDANTGDIVQPLQSFAQMRDGLKDIQAQVGVTRCGAAFLFLWFLGAGGSDGVQSVQRGLSPTKAYSYSLDTKQKYGRRAFHLVFIFVCGVFESCCRGSIAGGLGMSAISDYYRHPHE